MKKQTYKDRPWSSLETADLVAGFKEEREKGIKVRRFCTSVAKQFDRSVASCERNLILNMPDAVSYQWSDDELEILRSIKRRKKKLTTRQVLNLADSFPTRTAKALRTKIREMGIKVEDQRYTRTENNSEEVKPQIIGENSIYHKAAKLIGGHYENGLLYQAGQPLTGDQTMKVLAKVRDDV